MISNPLSQIIEIPDTSLSERLIPANDNHERMALSRENLEAESVLAPRDVVRPGKGPLLIVAGFCLLAAVLLVVWIH